MKQRKNEQKTTSSFEKARRKKQQKTKKKDQKTTISFEKKTTKKRSFIYLKNDLNNGNQWKRRKRQQNDENDECSQKGCHFSSLSSTRVRIEDFRFSLLRNRRFLIVFLRQKLPKPLSGFCRFLCCFVVIFM